ncbi:MAG: DUF4157 domain-containing protein [Kofleriaceae bacterium]
MKRDARAEATTRTPSTAEPLASPGKRTRTDDWHQLIATLGIAVAPRAPLFQDAAPWEQIQRQEDPAAAAARLLAVLQGIAADAIEARSTVVPRDTRQFRALASHVEALQPEIALVTDAPARAALDLQLQRTQDEIVLGFQALAAYHADRTLQAWHAEGTTSDNRATQRQAFVAGSGYPGADSPEEVVDWCGMFANTQLRAAGFAPELNNAFNHSTNVAPFFNYTFIEYRSPELIQPHGTAGEVSLREYHTQRGSLRSWLSGDAIGEDIRPGDIVVVDWDGDGNANHVCIVASYTPRVGEEPGQLVTIDGNAFGARKPSDAPPAFDGSDPMTTSPAVMSTSDVSTSQYLRTGEDFFDRSAMVPATHDKRTMTMLGRGRPSVVDFEHDHIYPRFTDSTARDPDGPSGPLQSRGMIQRAESGAPATGDPAAAFDTATAGAAGEIPFRDEMQHRLGADFSGVKAYTGRDLSTLGARAATRGEQVAFSAASPDKETIAHELTHVVQSRQGRAGGAAVSDPGDASEHEARAVASAVTAGEAVDVGGSPSAAIHRDEDTTVPDPVHPDRGGNRQDVPVDWADTDYFVSDSYRLPVNNTQPGSIGEVREFYLLRHLASELPALTAEYGAIPDESIPTLPGRHLRHTAVTELNALIQTRMQEAITAGDAPAAEAIRIHLFAANEHALADSLLIPGSTRHTPIPTDKDKDTWCNIYAFDVVTAMGGYLPRTWWTSDAITEIEHDGHPSTDRTGQVDANDMYTWMLQWGVTHYGWEAVPTPEDAQREADLGQLVIILASTGDKDAAGSGHVSVVMTSTAARQHPSTAETASVATPEVPGPFVPLQSQAGAENFSTNATGEPRALGSTGRRAWWTNGVFADLEGSGFGFFVYRADRANPGFGALALPTPEDMGTILPAGGGASGA